MIASASDVARLGTLLGIWAHPDDEAYLSGGLMALAVDAGSRVVCVTATRGELGTSDPTAWPPERLAAVRAEELARCLDVLGVTEHHWLGYPDGGCAAVPSDEAVGRLCDVLEEVAPDTVVTFGPDGITGHLDHRTVSAWASAAFDRSAPPGARLLHAVVAERWENRWGAFDDELGVFEPGYPVTWADDRLAVDLVLGQETVARKVRALAEQRTQTAGLISAMGRDRYTAWVRDETFVERSPGADGEGTPPGPTPA